MASLSIGNIKDGITEGYIRRIESVESQPVTEMSRWQLVQVLNPDGTRSRHLIGQCHGTGRVTSDIVKLDLWKLRGTTKSGRVYLLRGRSGFDGDADFVWAYWAKANSIRSAKLVTRALLRLHRLAVLNHVDPSEGQS